MKRWWNEITELVLRVVLQVPFCKEIVRRAGLKSGIGETIFEQGEFPRVDQQKVLYALTKNSDEDGDWSWKYVGAPAGWTYDGDSDFHPGEGGRTYNAGPPCGIVSLNRGVMNDPTIKSGGGHQSKMGHTFGVWQRQGGSIFQPPSHYGAPPKSEMLNAEFSLWDQTNVGIRVSGRAGHGSGGSIRDAPAGAVRNHLLTGIRIVAYFTRTVGAGQFRMRIWDDATNSLADVLVPHNGSPGRFVSDWITPETITQFTNQTITFGTGVDDLRIQVHGMISTELYYKVLNASGGNAPDQMSEEPRDMDGYVGIPFCQIELRTGYQYNVGLWIQDEYTPEEYRGL